MIVAGCNKPAHPDEKSAVNDALKNNNLSAVSVSQDRDKGVMTLKGDVPSEDQKNQAENIAKQAAPDYTIADEIGVRPPGEANAGSVASNLDSAIEDNYKAMIKAHADAQRSEHSRFCKERNARAQGIGKDGKTEEGSRGPRKESSERAAGRQRNRGQYQQALNNRFLISTSKLV